MEKKAFQLDSTVDMDARTFEGYASTWDKDLVGDIIMPGAFKKSIQEAFPAKRIKVLWQHGAPIGLPVEMREDERGLFVRGRVSKTALGDEALELMRDGVVDKMSIGFTIPAGKSDFDGETRIIREVKLMEFSPVTFPANPEAGITGVKQISELLKANKLSEADKKDLAAMLAELQALAAQPHSTAQKNQPLELGDLKALFSNFGASLGV